MAAEHRRLMARASSNFAARLRRMLLMVPWLLEVGGSTVAELAERFGVAEDDVIRDLNLVMCCGVPPYGAEDMITVSLDDDGSVMAWKGPFFTRPMRLTPAEGFTVLAAGRALLAVPGAPQDGPLATALAKLEAAVGSAGSVAVELEDPPHLAAVRAAVDEHERLDIAYYSAWRDDVTRRTIEPHAVFSSAGRWYVVAADSRSGSIRQFRVDRVASMAPTGEHFAAPASNEVPARPEVFAGGRDATEVTIVLPPAARWVAEAYDTSEVDELDDGRIRVRVAVAGERWLERLLLRVGPEAVVEAPPDLVDVGRRAARRLLATHYGG